MAVEKKGFEKDPKKWYKSRTRRMVFGVIGGFSEKTNLNLAILRITFLLVLYYVFPIAIITYIYLALTRPEDPEFLYRKNQIIDFVNESPGHENALIVIDRIYFVNYYYFLAFGMFTFIGLTFIVVEGVTDPLLIALTTISFFLTIFGNNMGTKIQIGSAKGGAQNTILAINVSILTSIAFLVSVFAPPVEDALIAIQFPMVFLIVLSTYQLYLLTNDADIKWLWKNSGVP